MKLFRWVLPLIAFAITEYANADSCQIIKDSGVVDAALRILAQNYPNPAQIELVLGPTPGVARFEPRPFEIADPRRDQQRDLSYLLVDHIREDGTKQAGWLDLGFTFYLDRASGKYLNLAKAAGCRTFGTVYPSLDDIPHASDQLAHPATK